MNTKDSTTAMAIIFLLMDVCEELNMIIDTDFKKEGRVINPKLRSLFLQLKYDVKDIRRYTQTLSPDMQERFGDTAESMKSMILYAYDRSSSEFDAIDNAAEYLKRFESKNRINLKRLGL